MSFPNLLRNCGKFLDAPGLVETQEGLTSFICGDCDFYKEGDDEHLECGAYKLIQLLLEQKVVTIEDIINAVRSDVSGT